MFKTPFDHFICESWLISLTALQNDRSILLKKSHHVPFRSILSQKYKLVYSFFRDFLFHFMYQTACQYLFHLSCLLICFSLQFSQDLRHDHHCDQACQYV